MGRRMATRQRAVERHRIERVVTGETARQVHLVALAGAEQLEDRVDPRPVRIAVQARPPHPCRRAVVDVGTRSRLCVAPGALEQRSPGTVAVDVHFTVRADHRDRIEPREHDVRHHGRFERRRSRWHAFECVPELERAPADPEAGSEGVQALERARAVRRHHLGGFDPDHGGVTAPDRRHRRAGGQPGDQRGRDRVGEAHPATVQALSPLPVGAHQFRRGPSVPCPDREISLQPRCGLSPAGSSSPSWCAPP